VDDGLDMNDVLEPLASLGAPVRHTVRKMPAAQLGEIHLDPLEPAASVSDARLVDSPLAIEGLASEMPGQGSPLALVEFRRLGGAVGRPVPGHGALNHLAGDFLLFCLGIEGASGTREEITSSFERVAQIMGSPGRTALNFIDDPIAARSEFPSTTYTRLQQIRRSVDPGDLMRASHPIELPSD
ncbi:MAG TPA: hypothetical protein VIG24_14850, partial [Acidimicrobiia bacterium]